MKITPEQARSLAEQLLDGEDSILEGLPAPEDDAAPLPETIGGYRILRLIASGGMGRVYEAEQIQPRRIVAIKVLRQGLSSRSSQRRFEYESELLGALHHPGIGTVFEAGMHDDGKGGVPFFVMEFIPGARPITAYADEKGLDIRQRLELLAQACDAVQYGHQKGIIHRDLKPANILVGEEKGIEATRQQGNKEEGERHEEPSLPDFKPSSLLPTPLLKIIDFGIARATDCDIAITTMHTEVGQLIGTLQYMSPEQCEGDPRKLDTRSDVYSLGVVLYELVCGRLPYDVSDTSIPHATRMIQESEPQRPSTISRKLKGDLETIALKALEKDREKRYQSAAELGAELRRYLSGEPIAARRAGIWTNSLKWAIRHPIATTSCFCITLAILTISATLVTVWILAGRPHDVILTENGQTASVRSITGNPIHQWHTPAKYGISDALFLSSDDHPQGKSLVAIGYNIDQLNPYPGKLCLYNINISYTKPFKYAEITRSDAHPTLLFGKTKATPFGVGWMQFEDIFDTPEGDEIVVCFKKADTSIESICIFDLELNLLAQYWHDGPLDKCYWIKDPGLLVILGHNSEVYWRDRGFPDANTNHPIVLFALKPTYGHISTQWTTPTKGGSQRDLVWYRCLIVPDTYLESIPRKRLILPPSIKHADNCVRLVFDITMKDGATIGMSMLIDAYGNEVLGLRSLNDKWQQHPNAPKKELIFLDDLPAIQLFNNNSNHTQPESADQPDP